MQAQQKSMRVINHKTMRVIIGLIAFLMPFAVWLLSDRSRLSSVSISYWTDSRDIFVGCLIVVGFFLSAYNGPGRCGGLEKLLSRAGCLFAICIALFPTRNFDKRIDGAPAWILYISNNKPQVIHYTAAISLFGCLFLMLLFFSFRASRKGKAGRSMTYIGFSLGMLLGMPVLYIILDKIYGLYDALFYVEWLGLGLFGAGWLTAGWYKTEVMEVPAKATKLKTIDNVDPSKRNFPTGIDVEMDAQYFFLAEGCWKDFILRCGPNGWGPKWNPFARKNRIEWQPFFMLCGNIGMREDKDLNFCIGDRNSWSVPDEVKNKVNQLEDRQLYLFANDWPTDEAYQNNKELDPEEGGPLKVTIYQLK